MKYAIDMKRFLIVFAVVFFMCGRCLSQESSEIVIDPIFEYPVAPETITDLNGKTNYLMDHFWDGMDFKSNTPVDQNALNHAFSVYCSSMPYASESNIGKSIKKLVSNIKGNKALTIQFTKAAEEVLFGPRAEFWADDYYMPFLENYLSNKKIDDSRKIRYREQYDLLKRTMRGAKAPSMLIRMKDGGARRFEPQKEFTLIEFGDPDCSDCRYARMKMDMSSEINDLLFNDRLEVMFIVADEDESIFNKTVSYPEKWTIGLSEDAADLYDLRAIPAFYILDKKGNIIAKNVPVDTAIEILKTASVIKK